MKGRILKIVTCLLVALVWPETNPSSAAGKKANGGRFTGTVHVLNKDMATIMVRRGLIERKIVYNSDTKWMYGRHADAKPSSLDQLQEGWYINCKGTFEGAKLVASTCRFRESK
jgi:hypothetical protein